MAVTDYTFGNRAEFPEHSLGKLILCRGEGTITLYGNMHPEDELRSMDLDEAKLWLRELCTTNSDSAPGSKADERTGQHKMIRHEGDVLGGTIAIRKGSILYMFLDSQEYGPIHPEAVEMCLKDSELSLEHKYLDMNQPIPSLEEYLEREGKR